jgi:hypothetical protein
MTHNDQPVTGYHSGDTLFLNVTAEDEDGNVVDIRNTTIKWALAERVDPTTIVLEKDNAGTGGVAITDGVNGEFEITIDPVDTEDLEGRYQHEAEITDTQGDVTTVFTGRFQITEDIIE